MATRTILYTYSSRPGGTVYRVRAEGVATVTDEPYPPGGFLRVMRDEAGRLIGGPLVSELLTFSDPARDDAATPSGRVGFGPNDCPF